MADKILGLATADQRGMGENFNELLRRLQSGAGKVVSDIGNATSAAADMVCSATKN